MSSVGAGQVPLEARVLTLWRIRLALVLALVCLVSGVVVGVAGSWGAGAGVSAIAAVVGGVIGWWWTALVWRNWRFTVGPDALHLDHGVLTRRSSTIPYHRVQHIDLEAGPLERRLRLTTLVLRTASASTDSTVPGIDAADADVVRAQILSRVGTGDAT